LSKQNDIPLPRRVRSFVHRQGRLTIGQARALRQLLPIYGLPYSSGMQDFSALFARSAATVFEIGFGDGSSLLKMAQLAPQTNFIGVEVYRPGIGALLLGIEKYALNNIRIYQADAIDILTHCIPANSLARIQIYFPDPWHKTKHHKRRLIQPSFVNLVYEKLSLGGGLHIATDCADYAKQILHLLDCTQGFSNQAGDKRFSTKPTDRPTTKFERRGQRLGHAVWNLFYIKC